MNKLQRLIEKATQKSEMRWKVYAFDPEKDNAPVGTPKAYDCICKAGTAKMEILKDHPNYIVEIIAESAQKNESQIFIVEFNYDDNAPGQARGQCQVKANSEKEAIEKAKKYYSKKGRTGLYDFRVNKHGTKYSNDVMIESKQKNEGRPQIGDTVKYTSHARQTSGSGKIVKVYRDYGNNLWVDLDVKDRYGKPISLLANRMKQTSYHSFEYFGESRQKNEGKTIDDISTRELGKCLKEYRAKVGKNKILQNSSMEIANEFQRYFGLSKKPSFSQIREILDNMPKEYLEAAQYKYKVGDRVLYEGDKATVVALRTLGNRNWPYYDVMKDKEHGKIQYPANEKELTPIKEAANIDVKNPGVLEVPNGKNIQDLPQSHFEKLVDKKGYAEVIRALTNLEVWNKDKNKSLSRWASSMADKLKKKYRPESSQKNEDEDDMVDVVDKNGNIEFIPLDDYLKNKSYYDNNVTKYAKKQSSIKQKQQSLDKLNALTKEIKKKEQELKGSYGANSNALDKELSKLNSERDKLLMSLYGKTFNQLHK